MNNYNVIPPTWARLIAHQSRFPQCITRWIQTRRKSSAKEIRLKIEYRQRISDLQDQDQHLIRVTKNRLNTITQYINEAAAELKAASSSDSKLTAFDGDGSDQTLPKYVLRDKPRDTSATVTKTLHQLEHLRLHLQDLQIEAYPDRSRNKMAVWTEEARKWPDERKEEELQELQLQEEADRKRLRDSAEHVMTYITELIRTGSNELYESAAVSRPVKLEPQVTKRRMRGTRNLKLDKPTTSGKDRDVTHKKEEKSDPVAETDSPLLQMQSQLKSAIQEGTHK